MAKKVNIVISAIDQASKSFKKVTSHIRIMNEETVQASQRMGIALAAAATAVGVFGLSMIKAAAAHEQSEVAFTTMLGSAEKAKTFMEDLANFAARTPFELTGLEEASKKLLAYGIEQEKILPSLENLGNIAAGVGMDKLPQLILAFGQVKAATKLTGMELRQFSEAGVPLLDALSKSMKKTVPAIQEMVSAGEVGFKEVEAALGSLSGEGGKFANLMAMQAKTLAGKWSNLADAWDMFLRNEGKALLDWGKDFVDMLIDLVTNALPKLISGIKSATKWLGEHKIVLVAIGGLIVGTLIPAIVSLGTTIVATLAATGPVGLTVAALATAIYGIAYAIDAVSDSTELLSGRMNSMRSITDMAVAAGLNGATVSELMTKNVQKFTVSVRKGDEMMQSFAGTLDDWSSLTMVGADVDLVAVPAKKAAKEIKDSFDDSMKGSYDAVKNFTLKGGESLASFRLNMIAVSASAHVGTAKEMDELTQLVINDVSRMQNAMEQMWGGFVSSAEGSRQVLTDMWVSFRQGVGDSVAATIMEGRSLAESFRSLMKSLVSSLISALVQMGIERMVLSFVYGTANLKEITSRMASQSAATYAGAFASSVGIPVIGPVIAPGIAAAAVATMLAGASASAGAGAGAGAAIGALGGGLENVPAESTYLLHAGERVLSPRQNKELTDYIHGGGGGGGIVIKEINVMPNSSIDEALFNKPISWWSGLVREKILPALNSLGRAGHKTSIAYDSAAVD